MTVRELIHRLRKADPDATVGFSSAPHELDLTLNGATHIGEIVSTRTNGHPAIVFVTPSFYIDWSEAPGREDTDPDYLVLPEPEYIDVDLGAIDDILIVE